MPTERLQKLLAAAGFGARRSCEDLILDGRVRVNGHRVDKLPVLVEPGTDHITVDGKPVRAERRVYFLLNKPTRVVCTNKDQSGRKRAVDLMVGVRERVFPVGRLDVDSMGLLIMTNDGELSQKLTHPRFSVPKTYRAEVDGSPTTAALEKLREGVWLSDGRTGRSRIQVIHRQRTKATLEITLREGRNRQVRRMLAKLGYEVRRLTRIRMGKLSIARLSPGSFRPLTPAELKYLHGLTKKIVDEAPASRPRRSRRRTKGPSAAGAQSVRRGAESRRSKARRTAKPAADSKPAARGRAAKTSKQPQDPKPRRRMILPE